MELPRLSRKEIDDLTSPAAIEQQLDKMKRKGLIPSDYGIEPKTEDRLPLAAHVEQYIYDVVDAVKWQDSKFDEIKTLNTQDMNNEKPWLDDLLEDFIVFDISPSLTSEEAKNILKGLSEEMDKKWDSYGPEARNYIFKLKRELELFVEKL